jgi:outer membrane lipoprotein-sorting protein
MRTVLLFALFCEVAFPSPDAAESEILAKMDQAGPAFHSMSANIKRVTYTAIIKDTSIETGTILMKKNSSRDVQVLISFTAPDLKTVAFHGNKAEIYYPKIKTVQEYDLGKQRGLVDQFLLLGFGTTGKELAKGYTIQASRKEVVAGQETTQLTLIPKSKQVRDQFPQMDLWISDATGEPAQQKLVEPSGNYYLITFTEVKLNPNLSPSALKLELPRDVVRERPQK